VEEPNRESRARRIAVLGGFGVGIAAAVAAMAVWAFGGSDDVAQTQAPVRPPGVSFAKAVGTAGALTVGKLDTGSPDRYVAPQPEPEPQPQPSPQPTPPPPPPPTTCPPVCPTVP
jgi:hypothetical protein